MLKMSILLAKVLGKFLQVFGSVMQKAPGSIPAADCLFMFFFKFYYFKCGLLAGNFENTDH